MEHNASAPAPLSPADETLVLRHKEIISKPIEIILVYANTEAGGRINDFCTRLEKLLPSVTVVRQKADDEYSSIHISGNIHFFMIPTGKLLEFFLFALLGAETLAGQEMELDKHDLERRIVLPAALKMYVTSDCLFCNKVIPKGLFLAGAAPTKIDIQIIDAIEFFQLAKSDGVRSSPATILDDIFRWSGDFDLSEIVDVISGRNPVQLGYDTLKKMCADGNAEGVAALMNDYDTVIPAFLDLLAAEKWPERLGAMVAFEYLVEKNPQIAKQVLDKLWESFDAFDSAIMGDVLHLFGVFGRGDQDHRLKSVLEGAYPGPVRKVAREVLEALESPQGG